MKPIFWTVVAAALGVTACATSPLGRSQGLLEQEAVAAIAAAHGRTAGQVVLRWHLQLGLAVIPKSTHADRIKENIDVFDFALSDAEIATLSALTAPGRIGPDPDTFNRA